MIPYYYPCKPMQIYPSFSLTNELDNNLGWIAEVKKRGWRCLVYKENGKVTLYTRHRTIINDPLPEIREYLKSLPDNIVLDGELIEKATKNKKGILYLFDIIYKDKLLCFLPLFHRRRILEEVLRDYPLCIQLSQWTRIGKKKLYEISINEEDEEGIVMKKLDSVYLVDLKESKKTPYWLKLKKDEKHIEIRG